MYLRALTARTTSTSPGCAIPDVSVRLMSISCRTRIGHRVNVPFVLGATEKRHVRVVRFFPGVTSRPSIVSTYSGDAIRLGGGAGIAERLLAERVEHRWEERDIVQGKAGRRARQSAPFGLRDARVGRLTLLGWCRGRVWQSGSLWWPSMESWHSIMQCRHVARTMGRRVGPGRRLRHGGADGPRRGRFRGNRSSRRFSPRRCHRGPSPSAGRVRRRPRCRKSGARRRGARIGSAGTLPWLKLAGRLPRSNVSDMLHGGRDGWAGWGWVGW